MSYMLHSRDGQLSRLTRRTPPQRESLRSSGNRPFELDGWFYNETVKWVDASGKTHRRRALVFVTNGGVTGASQQFNRAEAHHRAQLAEHGQTLALPANPTPAQIITSLLKARGFPVRNELDQVSDLTSDLLTRELTGGAT